MKLFLITYFIQPNVYQILSLRHVINVKVVNELFYILFILVLSPKPGVYFTLTAQLTSDQPYFKCWVVTHGYCPPHRTTQDLLGECKTHIQGASWRWLYDSNLTEHFKHQLRCRSECKRPPPLQLSHLPHSIRHVFHSVCHAAAVQLWNAQKRTDKRTSAVGKGDGFFHPNPEPRSLGYGYSPGQQILHHRTEPFISRHLHVFIGTKDGTRWFLEIPFGSQISLVVNIICILVR